jgi:hypothetical protein
VLRKRIQRERLQVLHKKIQLERLKVLHKRIRLERLQVLHKNHQLERLQVLHKNLQQGWLLFLPPFLVSHLLTLQKSHSLWQALKHWRLSLLGLRGRRHSWKERQ